MSDEPVTRIPSDEGAAPPEDGIALCLSGGGYRAMVFHIGALWRLYETGLLGTIKRISTVSGGSITGGMLGLAWRKLSFDPARLKDDFVPHVVMPLRRLAGETIDADAIIIGSILPGRISDRVAGAYDAHLFNGATPAGPAGRAALRHQCHPMCSRACCGGSPSPICATIGSAR